MASSKPSTSSPASCLKPKKVSAVGYTTYPKKALSYRWVISGAKSLLKSRQELTSPPFTVSLLRCDDTWQSSTWYLQLCLTYLLKSISIHLRCSENGKDPADTRKSFWITGCTFSVVDEKADEVKHHKKLSQRKCTPGKKILSLNIPDFIKRDKLKEFIVDDALTLQVTASLNYFDHTVDSITNETSPIPPHNVLDGMKKLYEEMSFADVTVKCGDKEFRAHKAVLVSQSPVFSRMLDADMKEKREGVIEVTDIDPTVMSDLIAFLYTGNAPNLHTEAKGLLHAATKYEIPRLMVLCENEIMINLHADNLLETVQLADTYEAPNLKKACFRRMRCTASEMVKTDAWKDFKESANIDLAHEFIECIAKQQI